LKIENFVLNISEARFLPLQKRFTTQGSSSRTRRRSIRLSPIVEYSRLQPPVGVWTVSQFQCWGSRSHAPYPS